MGTKIDGRLIADSIIHSLQKRTAMLVSQGITPTLVVILVGNNPSSLAYIRQKEKIGKKIGAKFILHHFQESVLEKEIMALIKKYNTDSTIHGIIVQIPLPPGFDTASMIRIIRAEKDVDGFLSGSLYPQPVAEAVLRTLESVNPLWHKTSLICVVGRGHTAGKPIAAFLAKKGGHVTVVHRQTPNPEEILKSSDIVISCVGKPSVITSADIKKGAIVIGVGLHQEQGTLKGDYDEQDMAKKALYYTPTPGGVGPVNVACLWENVLMACEQSDHTA